MPARTASDACSPSIRDRVLHRRWAPPSLALPPGEQTLRAPPHGKAAAGELDPPAAAADGRSDGRSNGCSGAINRTRPYFTAPLRGSPAAGAGGAALTSVGTSGRFAPIDPGAPG